ncbi:hypothetical protein ABZT17_14845 [Streptomyces sp. NPDC005648]|uniref:hypothetical protein n=1 Tax=Streptomyces sp. NPDC005648 TaxID=3157044 RepID=UPI0033AC13A6
MAPRWPRPPGKSTSDAGRGRITWHPWRTYPQEPHLSTAEEGSWGSGGGVLPILSLVDSGVFTEEKAQAVRAAVGGC